MAGTLGGALAARGIPSVPDNLTTDVEADIEQEDRMILLSRVRLTYHVKVPRGKRADAERAVAAGESVQSVRAPAPVAAVLAG